MPDLVQYSHGVNIMLYYLAVGGWLYNVGDFAKSNNVAYQCRPYRRPSVERSYLFVCLFITKHVKHRITDGEHMSERD